MTDSSMRLNLSIIRPPLKLIQFFPNNTLQRVVLNGQNSSWTPVFAGILQGSVFWPLRVQGSDLCFYWSPSMTLLKAFHKLYMEPSTDIIHHCFLLSRTLNEYAVLFFFFNLDSLHARLNSHYEAWSSKKRSTKKIKYGSTKDITLGLPAENVFQSWHLYASSESYFLKEKCSLSPSAICYSYQKHLGIYLDRKLVLI